MSTLVINAKISAIFNIVKKVKNSPTGVTFVSVKEYENKANEISNYLINVGVSLVNAKNKDIEYLENLDVSTLQTTICKDLLNEARLALIKALKKPNENRSKGQKNAYTTISKGIRLHNETNRLHVYGFFVKKDVIVKGVYKKVNSRPLTIAKNFLRKSMKSTKFRTMILEMADAIK
tara:strand:+ start:3689 stop:4219 length:531 start_codon:yes stop_codon:yes gene_type:complete